MELLIDDEKKAKYYVYKLQQDTFNAKVWGNLFSCFFQNTNFACTDKFWPEKVSNLSCETVKSRRDLAIYPNCVEPETNYR